MPASVNAIVAAAKARVHPDIQKTAGDMIVPFDRLAESIALYRRLFEAARARLRDLGTRLRRQSASERGAALARRMCERGHDAILEMARAVIAMGGAPLAEHGVGRSALKQRLLRELYGDDGNRADARGQARARPDVEAGARRALP